MAAATAQAVLASRTPECRNGPCRVPAPHPTRSEDGKGRGEGHEEYDAPRRQKPPPQAFFQLFDEKDAERGMRPTSLAEPRGPQERFQLRTVEHMADVVPMVQNLDIPVPLMVDQLMDACRHLDLLIPEQVIEVPKISSSSRHSCRRLVPLVHV